VKGIGNLGGIHVGDLRNDVADTAGDIGDAGHIGALEDFDGNIRDIAPSGSE
jgi:hypothetical protein